MITPSRNSIATAALSPRGRAREKDVRGQGPRVGDVWLVTDVAPLILPTDDGYDRVGKVEYPDWELVTVVSWHWTLEPGSVVWTTVSPRFGLCGFRDDWFGSAPASRWRRVEL